MGRGGELTGMGTLQWCKGLQCAGAGARDRPLGQITIPPAQRVRFPQQPFISAVSKRVHAQ